MNYYISKRIFFGFAVFVAIINLGFSLECITCNVTREQQNNCQLNSKSDCLPNSVCLSSTYEVTSAGVTKTFITKSCHMKNGQECSTFLKNQEVLHGGARVKERHCDVCEKDGCNLYDSGAASISNCLGLVFGLFSFIMIKFLA